MADERIRRLERRWRSTGTRADFEAWQAELERAAIPEPVERPRLPSRRELQLAGELGTFLREYRRKAVKGWDPNDRGYSRRVEHIVKRMDPRDLDELLDW